MWTLLKSEVFQWKKVVNRNELTSWVNDWNVIKLESVKREKITSEENPEIELFSTKIRLLVSEIVTEITDKWHKKNWLFKYFAEDWLKNIQSNADILSDKMFISALLMNERLSNTESKTYVPFSDDQKLEEIKFFLVSEFKDKIENILNLNSNTYTNAYVINLFNN